MSAYIYVTEYELNNFLRRNPQEIASLKRALLRSEIQNMVSWAWNFEWKPKIKLMIRRKEICEMKKWSHDFDLKMQLKSF